MRKNSQNLWGALPPETLPTSCTLEGRYDVNVYESTKAPKGEWHLETLKVQAQEWNQLKPSIWLEFTSTHNPVKLNSRPLHPGESIQVANHSPYGFNWGYLGSGPAQLALAVCIELYGIPVAQRVYQKFKAWFIAGLPQGKDFDTRIGLEEFNRQVVIPETEELKRQFLREIDEAKAAIKFLEWLPSNADNLEAADNWEELKSKAVSHGEE